METLKPTWHKKVRPTVKKDNVRLIDKIITKVDCSRGAPLGRNNIGVRPKNVDIIDCVVPMYGAYDRGGAYWGLGNQLRVQYTQDLSYIFFYRSTQQYNDTNIA